MVRTEARSVIRAALLGLCMITAGCAASHSQSPGTSTTRTGSNAAGDWTTDRPGMRRLITTSDLSQPFESRSIDNGPRIVARPKNAWPQGPAGFQVELLAENLNNPRKIITAPNGDIFVAESKSGRIRLLRLGEDNRVQKTEVFAEHLKQPFGIAFYPPGPNPSFVYIANTDAVVRFPYTNGDLKAVEPAEPICELPSGGLLRGGGHWTRDIVFSQDGQKMYVSVGSASNNDDNPEKERNRAAVLEFNPDGTGFRIFASGVRNAVGLTIEPVTGKLWGSVNERDGLGDDIPFDYITHFEDGGYPGSAASCTSIRLNASRTIIRQILKEADIPTGPVRSKITWSEFQVAQTGTYLGPRVGGNCFNAPTTARRQCLQYIAPERSTT